MLVIPEYDLSNPPSLKVLTEDDVISQGEAKWFRRQLERIAGKNRFGGPNIQCVWGPTHIDPMSADNGIKYLDFVFAGEQFGERRFFLEIWRSPEFLVRSGRYQQRLQNEPDEVTERAFCRACQGTLTRKPDGEPDQCACGSTRYGIEEERIIRGTKLLNDFPSEGCYDYWLRLERANLTYHPLDNEAVEIAKALWKWELTPQNERDQLEQADRELERRQTIEMMRRQGQPIGGAIYTGAVPLIQ